MSIQTFHTSHDVVCRTKKKQTQNSPPMPCDTSQRYLQHLSMYAFLIKIGQIWPFQNPTLMHKNSMWKFSLQSSTAMTPGIVRIMRLIFVLEPLNFPSGKRFEVCVTFDTVLSNEWANFIIQISNAFFNA